MGPFFLEKNKTSLEQRTHKSGASKNMEPYLEKKHFVNASKATGVSLERKSGMQAILHLPNCEADQNHGIWSEMGPYGPVGAHIKTGRSPMPQDHL